MTNKNIFKNETKKLWNDKKYVKKYKNFKYSIKDSNTKYLVDRRNAVINYLNKLSGNNLKILELGFGGGQNSKFFIDKSKKYIGIDISQPLVVFAKKKHKKSVTSNKAKFLIGSMDKKLKIKSNSCDVVIIIGALQYVINPKYSLKECRRVLKKNGHLIISQTNTFQINEMINLRKLIIHFGKYLLNETKQKSHSDSLRSLFFETKLKKYFKKYEKSWLFNNFIFRYGCNDKWKYQTNRSLLSFGRLRKTLINNNFTIIESSGHTFFYGKKNFVSKIIFSIFNIILNSLNRLFLFSYILRHITASNTFLVKKR